LNIYATASAFTGDPSASTPTPCSTPPSARHGRRERRPPVLALVTRTSSSPVSPPFPPAPQGGRR
jgi:hypothetical protein